MEHMTLIPKPKESAFWQYTRKSIAKKRASASLEEQQQQQLLSSPSHSIKSHSPSPDGKSRSSRKPPETLKYSSLLSAKLPPGASKQLCDIFTAISSVERSKQVWLFLENSFIAMYKKCTKLQICEGYKTDHNATSTKNHHTLDLNLNNYTI